MSDKQITIPADLWGMLPSSSAGLRAYADDIQIRRTASACELIRRLAQAKDEQHPPRMDEPGWGEKVEAAYFRASTRQQWLRYRDGGDHKWRGRDGTYADWGQLIDPRQVTP